MQEDSMAFSDASQYCAMQDYIMSRGALHPPRLAAASLSSICNSIHADRGTSRVAISGR